MPSSRRRPSVLAQRGLFAVVALFWLLAGASTMAGVVSVGGGGVTRYVVGGLMLANGLVLAFCAYASQRGNRYVDLLALLVASANAILSITDEMGAWDWISLVASVLLVGLVIGNGYADRSADRRV